MNDDEEEKWLIFDLEKFNRATFENIDQAWQESLQSVQMVLSKSAPRFQVSGSMMMVEFCEKCDYQHLHCDWLLRLRAEYLESRMFSRHLTRNTWSLVACYCGL